MTTLHNFLTRYGDSLAQRVTLTCQILHDPIRDAGTTPDMDARLPPPAPLLPGPGRGRQGPRPRLLRPAPARLLLLRGNGGGQVPDHARPPRARPRPLRTLVMCPPHLTGKWAREAQGVLPDVHVISLAGPDALARLTRFATRLRTCGRIPPTAHEVWILGRERAKLHHTWRPAYATRLMYRVEQRWTPQGPVPHARTWRDPACLRCGQAPPRHRRRPPARRRPRQEAHVLPALRRARLLGEPHRSAPVRSRRVHQAPPPRHF